MRQNLFEEFEPCQKQDWLAQAAMDLGDKLVPKSLETKTLEGIAVQPFFTKEDREKTQWLREYENRLQRFSSNPEIEARSWSNVINVKVADDLKANLEIKMVLENGADGLVLEMMGGVDFGKVLDGVSPGEVPIWLKVDQAPLPITRQFFEWAGKRVHGSDLVGGLIWDPLVTGFEVARTKKEVEEELVAIHELTLKYPEFKGLALNTGIYQEAGGSAVQELGYGWAGLVEMTDILTNSGFSAASVFQNLFVSAAVGGDYFMEMAKLRALRIGVFQLAQLYEASILPEDVYLFVSTSILTKSAYSPYNNMMRNTTEAISAILGGCNALHVTPHDTGAKSPKDFSKRIARNVSTILKEESFMDKVADPMAGTYYLENLTDSLYQHAVALLQEVEKSGGWWSSYKRNDIQKAVKATRKLKQEEILHEKSIVVGLNKYIDTDGIEIAGTHGGSRSEETFQLKPFSLDSLFKNPKNDLL